MDYPKMAVDDNAGPTNGMRNLSLLNAGDTAVCTVCKNYITNKKM